MTPEDEQKLWRSIAGSVRATINEHGPITKDWAGSAAKRIMKNLLNLDGIAVVPKPSLQNQGGRVSIHKVEDGFVIASGGMWLPGLYEDERTARFAFRCTNEQLVQLRDAAIKNNKNAAITWGDIARLRSAAAMVAEKRRREGE